jgi:hypothetical protein
MSETMKTSHIFGISLIFITLIFLLASANFSEAGVSAHNLGAASLSARQVVTPSPAAGGESEIGSTDGIVIMGVVLVVIVTMPILFRRKRTR